MGNPLTNFANFPVLLAYKLKDGTCNVMTNGAWTWYYKEYLNGTIHELGNHSFTYNHAEDIRELSLIFVPANKFGENWLLTMGSNSALHGESNRKAKVLNLEQWGFNWETMIHRDLPTWKLRTIDVHNVRDVFKILSTEFISQHNAYPTERIVDEGRKMHKLVKGDLT